MQIPHTQLSAKTLSAIILEFVTRDGTDHSSIEKRIASVRKQLKNGQVELHFDEESETCNIIRV
ncbi:MAG: YheU family protein [Pirellulaceae bacterium]